MASEPQVEASRRMPFRSRRNIAVAVATCVVTTFAVLSIGVAAGLATVGWHTIGPAEQSLPPYGYVITPNPVYSRQMRMYQNQTQVDPSDPTLWMIYRYPSDGRIYADTPVFWNSGSPVNWYFSGGNKYASCENFTGSVGGRWITCQFYSTV